MNKFILLVLHQVQIQFASKRRWDANMQTLKRINLLCKVSRTEELIMKNSNPWKEHYASEPDGIFSRQLD